MRATMSLVRRLRDGQPIGQAGVARVPATLMDPFGPLYLEKQPGALREWDRATLDELDDDGLV